MSRKMYLGLKKVLIFVHYRTIIIVLVQIARQKGAVMIKINLLKSELMKKNYSIKNVAEWLGKSEPAVYRKLNGKTNMSLIEASIICNRLGLDDKTSGQIFLGR